MRILQIVSDPATAAKVEDALKRKQIHVHTTGSGAEGVLLAGIYPCDLILLSLELADMSGYRVLQKIRAYGITTPIIVVTKHSSTEGSVRSLNSGADDHVVTSVDDTELIARIRARVRPSYTHANPTTSVGNLTIDHRDRTVTISGQSVSFTKREYEILSILSLHVDVVYSRCKLVDHLYEESRKPKAGIISAYINRLRTKLREAGSTAAIETEYEQGYFLTEVQSAVESA